MNRTQPNSNVQSRQLQNLEKIPNNKDKILAKIRRQGAQIPLFGKNPSNIPPKIPTKTYTIIKKNKFNKKPKKQNPIPKKSPSKKPKIPKSNYKNTIREYYENNTNNTRTMINDYLRAGQTTLQPKTYEQLRPIIEDNPTMAKKILEIMNNKALKKSETKNIPAPKKPTQPSRPQPSSQKTKTNPVPPSKSAPKRNSPIHKDYEYALVQDKEINPQLSINDQTEAQKTQNAFLSIVAKVVTAALSIITILPRLLWAGYQTLNSLKNRKIEKNCENIRF